jgi:tRNA(Ile)-lysidine synthase
MSVKNANNILLAKLLQSLRPAGATALSAKGPDMRWLTAFFAHAQQFMQQHKLWGNRQVVVSVSGGADSMALLALAWLMRQRGKLTQLRAIHFNHGTRAACAKEQALVQQYCQQLAVPLECVSLKLQFGSNFEARARQLRQQHYAQLVGASEVIWQGHHCDDSFEWWLMHCLKSSQQVLGIKVSSGNLRRPWMCASRSQIRHWCQLLDVPFLIDESNRDLRFERNRLRAHMRPLLQHYPACLHHYTVRQNEKARELGTHASQDALIGPATVHCTRDQLGNQVFYTSDGSNQFAKARSMIRQALIQELSSAGVERSSLERPLTQLLQAAAKGQALGPMHFKAGVRAYLAPGRLAIVGHHAQAQIEKIDANSTCPTKMSGIFPFICMAPNNSKQRFYRGTHPLWPSFTQYCSKQSRGWIYLPVPATSQNSF